MCMMTESNNKIKDEEKIPSLMKIWVPLYRSVPTDLIKFPFTKDTSMAFTLLSSLFLLSCRLTIQNLMVRSGWPDTFEMYIVGGYLSAMIHSTCLCSGLFVLLRTQPFWPTTDMKAHPQWWQDGANAMMQFCQGYMIYDALYSLIWLNFDMETMTLNIPTADYCYLGHHIATTSYMLSCQTNGSGHMGAMGLMFLGEFSNPFQNTMLSMGDAIKMGECCSMPWMHQIFTHVEFAYAVVYSIFRIPLGPGCMAVISYDMLFTKEGRAKTSIPLKILWFIMGWGVLIGSIPWIYESLDMIKAYISSGGTSTSLSIEQEL